MVKEGRPAFKEVVEFHYLFIHSVSQQVHMKCVQCTGTELGAWNGAVIRLTLTLLSRRLPL